MKLQTTTQEIKVVTACYTPEEYLELEEKADYKNEYRDGEIISMTGGTTQHNKEEYLELEEKADYKNEYRDGEIISMTGGTTQHNKLAGNFYICLNVALNDLNYEIYIGDVKLWIPRYREFTYPDVMVIEGQPVYYSTNTTIVTNPLLIVEVLSKSTKDDDRGDKFLYYRSIPEFKEYILIDQTKYYVMQYVKTSENQWILTEYETEDAMINLSSINVELSLKQLYKKINFSENLE